MLQFHIGFTSTPDIANSLAYHFCHANVFHMAANIVVLWRFRPRLSTCVVAYTCAVLASLIPFAALDQPTTGLSAFIFAAFARKYATWRINPRWLLAVQVVLAFVPLMNWRIHILSFLLSYIFWLCVSKGKGQR